MTMPSSWVDKIFQKLTLVYGRDFLGRWEGVPLEEVKADWGHELNGYENAPQAIAYALQNLPPKAPTVLEFRAICRSAPAAEECGPKLEYSGTTQEGVRRGLAEARALLTRMRANA